MGTYMIEGKCVDLITYVQAMRLAKAETGLDEPPQAYVNRLALNRRQRILNECRSNRIAEGAD